MKTPQRPASTRHQRGNFVIGLIVGLLVGLALALGVALYIAKVPGPLVGNYFLKAALIPMPRRFVESQAGRAHGRIPDISGKRGARNNVPPRAPEMSGMRP